MRTLFLLAAAALLAPPAFAAGEAPRLPEATQACLDCHGVEKPGESDAAGKQGVFAPSYVQSVHRDLGCADCHAGYAAPGPHELPAVADPAEAALVAKLAGARTLDGQPVVGAPRAYLACGGCHADVWDDLKASPHGRWLAAEAKPLAGPTCASCHGSPHDVKPDPDKADKAAVRAYHVAQSTRCERCHGDPKFTEAMGLSAEVAASYKDSIHGRLVAIGSTRAPVCTDCHAWMVEKGGHKSIAGGKAAASSVFFSDPPRNDDARVRTCGQCHAASSANFAELQAHKPWQETHKVPHIVHVAFSWLTTLTLLFFAFHVAVDFAYELRRRLQRHKEHHDEADAQRTVLRFDLHQRIQHWLMLAGVILLGLTGWPLRGAGAVAGGGISAAENAARIAASQKFLALFGGPHGAGIVHRVAAVMIMLSGLYHLVYLVSKASKRTLPLSMLPGPKDALDIRDNLLFMLGLSKQRPRFDRYMYLEKFDYWAVFWGIVMMVGSGFVFWFPAQFARILPSWVITATQIIHGEEATLAILFLFVVHFYNVHLKPSIFPMNWAWLTGRITLEMQKEEHPLEYERTRGEQEPK
jgi:cytochrome b subunit of formate dehydrogenase